MEVCILGVVQKFNKEHCYLVRYHPFMKSMKAQWETESCGFDKKNISYWWYKFATKCFVNLTQLVAIVILCAGEEVPTLNFTLLRSKCV